MMGERPILRIPENTFEWTIHEPFYRWRNEFETEFFLNGWECLRWRMSVVTWWQGPNLRRVFCTLYYVPTAHPLSITANVSGSLTANGGADVHIPLSHHEFNSDHNYPFQAFFGGVHRDIGTVSGNLLAISLVINRLDAPPPTGVRAGHWGDLGTLEQLSSDLGNMYEHGRNPTLILIGIDRAEVMASIDEQLKADDRKYHQPGPSADSQKESRHFSSPASIPKEEEKEKEFKNKLEEEDKEKDKKKAWKRVVIKAKLEGELYEDELRAAIAARDEALPSTKFRKFKVHHAILEKRWPRYFTDHRLAYRRVYDTWMYSDILNEILRFIYSGEYTQGFIEFEASEPNCELKQILQDTDLKHMYDRKQRSTKVCCQTAACGLWKIFSVKLKIGTPNDARLMSLPQFNDAETPYFEIREGMFNRRPWLYYSISGMRSSCEVYIHFRDPTGRSVPVNILVHSVKEDGRVESGPVLYLGSQATFGDYLQGNELLLCFEVRYGHPINVIQRQFGVIDYGMRNLISLMKLSNDMREVLIQGNFTDTHVFSGVTTERKAYKLVHMAILTARVPDSMILIGYPDANCTQLSWYLQEESLDKVLIFIYTGEMPFVDDEYLKDMHTFAHYHAYIDLISFVVSKADWRLLAV